MNFVDPVRSDKSVTEDTINYEIGYYVAPTTLTGVTDESHSEYASGTTYSVGDYIKIDALKSIYRSTDDSNTGNYPPATPTKWTYFGPLNSYRMLAIDEYIGSQTAGTDIVMEFDFSGMTSFALLDMDFEDLTIKITNEETSTVICETTYTGTTYGCDSYYEYFYLPLEDVRRIVDCQIPWMANATILYTFTGATSIGAVIHGILESMGCSLVGTSLKFEDTSTIQKSEVTGFRNVTRYGSVKVVTVDVLQETQYFDNTAIKIEKIIGRNVLFIPVSDDNFSEMVTIGYFENFEMPALNSTMFKSQAVIIGVL